jgi:hypothetical protein
MGLYIPSRKIDVWWPPKIRDQVEQNILLIITFQESHTWINLSKIIFLIKCTTKFFKNVLKPQSIQYNDIKDIKKLQI